MANVQVIPRFRPLNSREKSEVGGANVVVDFDGDGKGLCLWTESGKKPNRFTFDHVFSPDSTQAEVFNSVAQPLVKEIFNGYNTTIFAYGQTGSGKTHTMMGNPEDADMKGIIPRMIESVFDGIAQADPEIEFTVKVSYVEIYNEKIRDLLDETKSNLRVRESPMGVWIEDVTEVYVGDTEQVYQVMTAGGEARAKSATNMNAESSRSHSVFIITLGQRNTVTGSKKGGKLTLVDLAGSEKISKTGAEGMTLKEAQHINKSLSALGNVINALTSTTDSKGPAHIPYRDSKLTYLLSDSLGGNSKTCLIITGSPSLFNVDETLSTIRFGNRAKNIKNKPKVNQEKSVAEYQRLLNLANTKITLQDSVIRSLEREVQALRHCLAAVAPEHIVVPIPGPYEHGIGRIREGIDYPNSPGSSDPDSPPTGAEVVELVNGEKEQFEEKEKLSTVDLEHQIASAQSSLSEQNLENNEGTHSDRVETDNSAEKSEGEEEEEEEDDLLAVWGAEDEDDDQKSSEEKDNEDADAEMEEAGDKLSDLPDKSVKKKVQKTKPDLDRRQSSLTLSKSTRDLIQANFELEAEKEEAERQKNEIQNELQELRRTLSVQAREAETELAELRKQLDDIQRERLLAEQTEQQQITELEHLKEQSELDAKKFELELSELSTTLKQSKSASEDAENRALSLQQQLKEATLKLESTKAQSNELQAKLDMSVRQLEELIEEKKRDAEEAKARDENDRMKEEERIRAAETLNVDDLFGTGSIAPVHNADVSNDIMSVMNAYSVASSSNPPVRGINSSAGSASLLEQQLIESENEKQRLTSEVAQMNIQIRSLTDRVELLAQQLRRKSDECLDTHLALVGRKEHIASLEEHIAKARRVAQEDSERAAKTVKMLQDKFFVVEAWCQELYNCARYWRKQSNRYRQTVPGGGSNVPISIRGHGGSAPHNVVIPGGRGTNPVPTTTSITGDAAVETDSGSRKLIDDFSAVRMPTRQYNPALAATLAAERKTPGVPASPTLGPHDSRTSIVNGAQVVLSPQTSPPAHWSKVFLPTSDGKWPGASSVSSGRGRSGSSSKSKGVDMNRFF